MPLTRKDFIELAREQALARPSDHDGLTHSVWLSECYAMAKVCKRANVNFDREKFIEACHQEKRQCP